MADDILINKANSIERCIERAREEYFGHEEDLQSNQTRQDALILNLIRACETAIDLAMHTIRTHRLGPPQSSRHAFELLREASIISPEIETNMKRMVGFRNVAIHQYHELNLDTVKRIVEERLDDFQIYISVLIKR